MFISFEGIDGSGKSTQAKRLAQSLTARGIETVLTREPGGSPGAEEIRRLLVEGGSERWSPETELLLFTAARRDHLERLIRPALARGAWVITDRFADSSRVYQGAARAEQRALVDELHRLMIGIDPGAFWSQMQGGVDVWKDVGNGVLKSLVFGFTVTFIALLQGFEARPTPEGVSRATTRTVVIASLAVLALDFVLTALMFSI